MELPQQLRTAINNELEELSSKEFVNISIRLSDRYCHRSALSEETFIQSNDDVMAYTAFRMPATFGAVYSSLKQVKELFSDWNPQNMLDVGAGPGTGMWAASEIWTTLKDITLVERDEQMIALGKRLSKYSSLTSLHNANWINQDITENFTVSPCDLVIASYVLNELTPDQCSMFISQLWELTRGVLVIIEPGTQDGFSGVKEARKQLISTGGKVIAPCPNDNICPNDWCHFSQRINRSRLHRQVKEGELPYEDEKFSFVAVSRNQGETIKGRVIRHPQIRKGHIIFNLCTSEGITNITVARKNRDLYRIARKLSWGSAFPLDESQ